MRILYFVVLICLVAPAPCRAEPLSLAIAAVATAAGASAATANIIAGIVVTAAVVSREQRK